MNVQDLSTLEPDIAQRGGGNGGGQPSGDGGGGGTSMRSIILLVAVFVSAFASAVLGAYFADDIQGWFGKDDTPSRSGGPTVADTPDTKARPMSAAEGALTVNEIYDAAAPAVVHIEANVVEEDLIFGIQRGKATGSGFVIDTEGHIVTNAHVVRSATDVSVSFDDDRTFSAEVIGLDISTDTAVLKAEVDKEALSPLEFADSSGVDVGDPVVAIGNPFNLDRTATSGIVSALQRTIQAENGYAIDDVIQTDAAINSGNSGGPLLNEFGQVIGINSQIQTPSGGNVGIAFAIPSNTVTRVIEDLIDNGTVTHAWLGVVGSDIVPELTEVVDLPVEEGVIIEEVLPDSPADKAGLEGGDQELTLNGNDFVLGGDILTKVDDEAVETMRELADIINDHDPGDEVTLTYWQGEEEMTEKVTLSERPDGELSEQ